VLSSFGREFLDGEAVASTYRKIPDDKLLKGVGREDLLSLLAPSVID
jgi:hypothetical protein